MDSGFKINSSGESHSDIRFTENQLYMIVQFSLSVHFFGPLLFFIRKCLKPEIVRTVNAMGEYIAVFPWAVPRSLRYVHFFFTDISYTLHNTKLPKEL